jgi:hypothetical protein
MVMSSRVRSRTAEAMAGASSLCMLIAGMSIISPDLRPQIASAVGDPAGQLGTMASRALDYGHVFARVARDYGGDNTALAGFGIVAVVLTIMMFRS